MKRRTFLIYTALLVVLTAAATVVHGRFSDRWGTSAAQLRKAAEALQLAPTEFGSWKLQKEMEFEDRVKGILGCAGSWSRTYVHKPTGQAINVAMIVGPPGPTSSHVAEMCYSTQGYRQVGQRAVFQLELPDHSQHEFAEINFVSPNVSSQKLQVCYSWRHADQWLVPSFPRAYFGGQPFLYKIQVAAYHAGGATETESQICQAFLREFLPELDRTVFSQPIP